MGLGVTARRAFPVEGWSGCEASRTHPRCDRGAGSGLRELVREHAARGRRPGLVHVDAYRLGGIEELDDLDLDTALDEVVTVVEWGEGVAEALSPSRLEVRIKHADGAPTTGGSGDEEGIEPRVVEVQGIGPRWATHSNRPTDGPARR